MSCRGSVLDVAAPETSAGRNREPLEIRFGCQQNLRKIRTCTHPEATASGGLSVLKGIGDQTTMTKKLRPIHIRSKDSGADFGYTICNIGWSRNPINDVRTIRIEEWSGVVMREGDRLCKKCERVLKGRGEL